ncbi:glycosyl transferase family 1 [Palleronia aestuarii]|uniref:Glycosyl transferase family 1 n=1 Tax=Palleronia aestuarii TaxID=568105 RepID=A0A2W7NC84_9RHOB|nr:glycosyltransferase [Palleronia aestuarii]PZX14344.1 glycosyl transferase family 1 [Palleronia aestuarii]
MSRRFHVVLPTLKPVGGIVKCYDYIAHALAFGLDVRVYCCERPEQAPHLFQNPRLAPVSARALPYHGYERLFAAPDDLYFFSLPTDFRHVEPLLRQGVPARNILHIVQNTRHAQVTFQDGYARRLLSRPMSRITINDEVRDAIRPFLHDGSALANIPLGHDCAFFERAPRIPPGRPLRVGFTTWKSQFGHRLAASLAGDDRFSFHAMGGTVAWPELRDFYHSVDVLLCTPNRLEGFYLPGLEAMAAGCIVVTPDVEGNMSYCRFDKNCFEYRFEDMADATHALERILALDTEELGALHDRAGETWRARSLDAEREMFRAFLREIDALPAAA